jgi:hypothetical protein
MVNNNPHQPGDEVANNDNTTNTEAINAQIQSDADLARRAQTHYALARFEAVAARLGIPINLVYERVQDVERREYKLSSAAKRAILRFGRGDDKWYEEFIVKRTTGAVAQAIPGGHASGRAGHNGEQMLVPAPAASRLVTSNPVPATTAGLIATGPVNSGASAGTAHSNGKFVTLNSSTLH